MTTLHAPIALITGGSRGLGRSAALLLGARGTDVIVTYRTEADAARAVVGELQRLGRKAAALPLDVAAPASFTAFADGLGDTLRRTWDRDRFDFLVNNAGSGLHASFVETTEAQLQAMIDIHLKGPYLLTQRLLPLLADGGRT